MLVLPQRATGSKPASRQQLHQLTGCSIRLIEHPAARGQTKGLQGADQGPPGGRLRAGRPHLRARYADGFCWLAVRHSLVGPGAPRCRHLPPLALPCAPAPGPWPSCGGVRDMMRAWRCCFRSMDPWSRPWPCHFPANTQARPDNILRCPFKPGAAYRWLPLATTNHSRLPLHATRQPGDCRLRHHGSVAPL